VLDLAGISSFTDFFVYLARQRRSRNSRPSPTRLRLNYETIIICAPPRLTASRRVNGSSSIISKSSSTSSIATRRAFYCLEDLWGRRAHGVAWESGPRQQRADSFSTRCCRGVRRGGERLFSSSVFRRGEHHCNYFAEGEGVALAPPALRRFSRPSAPLRKSRAEFGRNSRSTLLARRRDSPGMKSWNLEPTFIN